MSNIVLLKPNLAGNQEHAKNVWALLEALLAITSLCSDCKADPFTQLTFHFQIFQQIRRTA